ncbi:hypothetical protein ANCDUO_07228 [Ancylostoma duodenale]|uniref:Uncharacterized protein n=1 Tax=Ancylostoma duodenale TaxID=51022 RepID=A0A0C2CZK6_9BILA|nr:hypothetical protein ANCDUO_07228 [Ancylostoma duodenale]
MESIMATFYSALFKSGSGQTTTVLSPGEEVPPFLTSGVRHAIEATPRGEALGADGITVELLQDCGPTLYTTLAIRFSHYLAKCEVPRSSPRPSFFSKRVTKKMENYRPITLLPVLYKSTLATPFSEGSHLSVIASVDDTPRRRQANKGNNDITM